jgi:hypothetical protein
MPKPRLALALVVAVGLGGCAQRSAESAIAQAEKDIAEMQGTAEKVAPKEFKVLSDSVAAMKAKVAAGDYSGALMGARTVGSMARDLRVNLPGRTTQLTTSFTGVAATLPKQVDAVSAKVNELAALKKLPAGLDPARFAALKTDIATWTQAWAAADASFKAGNIADALTKANDLKAKVADAMKLVGIPS